MGKYVSIRGWLECEEQDVPRIKEICDYFTNNYNDELMKYSLLKLYQSGWVFPEQQVNWTTYIFYGAEVRNYYSDFIKEQIVKIGENPDITGYFLIDDHDNEQRVCWKLFNGQIVESRQEEI